MGHAGDRPVAPGKSHRTRQSRRRLPRKIGNRNRRDPSRRVGTILVVWVPNSRTLTACGILTPPIPTQGRIDLAAADIERFQRLLNDGKPALIFAAHLANWELPAICAATYELDSAVLYRRPEYCRHRSLAGRDAHSQHGRVDFDRTSMRRSRLRRRFNAAPMSACWWISITCAASR